MAAALLLLPLLWLIAPHRLCFSSSAAWQRLCGRPGSCRPSSNVPRLATESAVSSSANETSPDEVNVSSRAGKGRVRGQRRSGGRPVSVANKTSALPRFEDVEQWLPSEVSQLLRKEEVSEGGSRRLVGLAALLGLAGLAGGLAGGLGRASMSSWEQAQPELAYTDPVIRQGSVLLSRPGGQFAFSQPYFHKAVVLIVRHRADRDVGLILNRPTSLVSTQLGLPGPPWQLLFGGDVEGLGDLAATGDARCLCLHTMERFAAVSREVVRGVFLLDFEEGRELVKRGEARTTDFLLVVGYCGWGPGQLQRELDRGGTWKLATVDSRIIVRQLREEATEMRAMSRLGLDDGIGSWRRLYAAVDAGFLPEVEDLTGDDEGDLALVTWIEAALQGYRQRPWSMGGLEVPEISLE